MNKIKYVQRDVYLMKLFNNKLINLIEDQMLYNQFNNNLNN